MRMAGRGNAYSAFVAFVPFVVLAALSASAALAADQAHLWAQPFEDRSPRIYSSAVAAWRTASDFKRTRDIHLMVEKPVSDRSSALIGGWHGVGVARDYRDWNRLETTEWGVEAAFRHHPWPWMPGFFVQAMAGMAWRRGRNPTFDPSMRSHWSDRSPEFLRVENQDLRLGGLGFGYVWRMGPTVVDLHFLFGPRSRRTLARYERILGDGSRALSGEKFDEMDGLLHFHDLRIGFSL